MTANKPMTGEQLDELMTVAVNMQRDSEKAGDRPSAMFAYAVQVVVLELRKVRDDAAALAAENAGLKESRKNLAEFIHEELDAGYTLNMSIETPATDAFLAEVRAQGVEMMVEQCESDIMLIEPEDEEFYTLMIEHAKDFVSELRKGVQS
ncbi:hypothetical protein UXP16_09650 [Enterobacter bugandensis]|uniref:hypothetical protein n=1 Tax=Enterobacter bugandensis TaxID=881260 RepID=UPI002FD17022